MSVRISDKADQAPPNGEFGASASSSSRLVSEDLGIPFEVLVVDDDLSCLEAYAELVEALGYRCRTVPDALSALRLIAQNPKIAVVFSDLNMPNMDGLTFLEELSERFMSHRTIVAIVVSGQPTTAAVAGAMRFSAIDFIDKPVTLKDISAALLRAEGVWWQAQSMIKSGIPHELARLAKFDRAPAEPILQTPSPDELGAFAQSIMKTRQDRIKYFDAEILPGPAWDILFELAAASLEGRRVATSDACVAVDVPFSTAFRHVNQLVSAGLVRKVRDPDDKRRTYLELEPETEERMGRYLRSSWETLERHKYPQPRNL